MTPADDPLRAFRTALGRDLDARLNTTATVVALVHAAVTEHGWTPQQLAGECARDLRDVANAGAVITDRLRRAARHAPTPPHASAFGPPLPWCSPECQDNAGWVLDETSMPVRRCPCRTPAKEATPCP